MNDSLQKYAEIKKQISLLEKELDSIRPEVEKVVLDAEDMKLPTEFGEFKMVYVPKWKYSAKLVEEEKLVKEKLKLMKHKEEAEGTAEKITDGGRLVFTAKKGE